MVWLRAVTRSGQLPAAPVESLSSAAPLYMTSAGPERVLPVSVGGACGQLGSRTRNVLLFRTPVTSGFEPPGGSDYREYRAGTRCWTPACSLADIEGLQGQTGEQRRPHSHSHSAPHQSLFAANYLYRLNSTFWAGFKLKRSQLRSQRLEVHANVADHGKRLHFNLLPMETAPISCD